MEWCGVAEKVSEAKRQCNRVEKRQGTTFIEEERSGVAVWTVALLFLF